MRAAPKITRGQIYAVHRLYVIRQETPKRAFQGSPAPGTARCPLAGQEPRWVWLSLPARSFQEQKFFRPENCTLSWRNLPHLVITARQANKADGFRPHGECPSHLQPYPNPSAPTEGREGLMDTAGAGRAGPPAQEPCWSF